MASIVLRVDSGFRLDSCHSTSLKIRFTKVHDGKRGLIESDSPEMRGTPPLVDWFQEN